jgi:undecaprenyl-diphosphatase
VTGGRGVVLPVWLALILGLLDPVHSLDGRVQEAVQRSRGPVLDQVVRTATGIARPPVVLALTLGVAIWGGPAGLATARHAVLAMIPANLAVEGLKRLVNRPRPDGERRRSNSSFPSSHAANAFAMAWVLGRRWRRFSIPFWLLAAAVGWSRMYLNRHFLSDVLCGAIIGVTCAWCVGRLARGRIARGAEGRAEEPGLR